MPKYDLVDDTDESAKVEPAYDDYIHENIRDYGKWLENVSWRVIPTIVMKDVAPLNSIAKIMEEDLFFSLALSKMVYKSKCSSFRSTMQCCSEVSSNQKH